MAIGHGVTLRSAEAPAKLSLSRGGAATEYLEEIREIDLVTAGGRDKRRAEILFARQPILDRERNVYGYELLFRSDPRCNSFDGTEAADATMQVLSCALTSIGTESLLLKNQKAFINFDLTLLQSGMYLALPSESIIIEILETVEPGDELDQLCRRIKQQGYCLALDDFADAPGFESLTRIAGIIKVDFRATPPEEQERLLRTYKPRGILMLAEKIESDAEFQRARKLGFDLFQGYFFARPTMMVAQQIPPVKSTCLRLLREVQAPEVDFEKVARLIREDVSLTYKLLRYVNSPLFPMRVRVDSINRALLALGSDGIRRWISLVTLPMLAVDKPAEAVRTSLIRAHFCEQLAGIACARHSNEAFLMGMFSLLDALMDVPLETALRSVDLSTPITGALLGLAPEDEPLRRLFHLMNRYEAGDWDSVERLARKCGIAMAEVGECYAHSLVWSACLMNVHGAPAPKTPAVPSPGRMNDRRGLSR